MFGFGGGLICMFKSLIITIAVCSVMQCLVQIIAPETHVKNVINTTTNVIFVAAIFTEIFNLIHQLLL